MAKIILAPTYDLAKTVEADATVEAEYGDECVQGKVATLAHHGSRSANPAPCNTPNVPVLPENATILVSHLDLDAVGGIMALEGKKPNDEEFWKAAEYIDVNGTHHVHELPQNIQDKLNAEYAWNNAQPRVRYTEITDVTDQYNKAAEAIRSICNEHDEKHDEMIEEGKRWNAEATKAVESCLVSENDHVRAFDSNGVFCAASYYSPKQDRIIPATVTYNEKFKAVTVAMADGGKTASAKDIVQELWGPEAGGRAGIAGSPRGVEMTHEDFEKAVAKTEEVLVSKERNQNKERVYVIPSNDAEAVAIGDMLREQGYQDGKNLFVTKQAWGASWDNLEQDIKEAVDKTDFPVYGIELQGQTLTDKTHNIDHHAYQNDDRSNPKSSIEQVAKLEGVSLTRKQELIAANDRAFIPGMEKLGATREEIQEIRALDRSAQGITEEQEKQAVKAIKEAEIIEGPDGMKTVIVHMPHSKCATVTDRMYGEYDNLLCVCGDGETDFYGKKEIIDELNEKYPGGWKGGDLEHGNGFWGVCADQNKIEETVRDSVRLEKVHVNEQEYPHMEVDGKESAAHLTAAEAYVEVREDGTETDNKAVDEAVDEQMNDGKLNAELKQDYAREASSERTNDDMSWGESSGWGDKDKDKDVSEEEVKDA